MYLSHRKSLHSGTQKWRKSLLGNFFFLNFYSLQIAAPGILSASTHPLQTIREKINPQQYVWPSWQSLSKSGHIKAWCCRVAQDRSGRIFTTAPSKSIGPRVQNCQKIFLMGITVEPTDDVSGSAGICWFGTECPVYSIQFKRLQQGKIQNLLKDD